jgi:hypothetical protein
MVYAFNHIKIRLGNPHKSDVDSIYLLSFYLLAGIKYYAA